nr:nucleotide sugar dehydrogenase [Enterococcus faecalis]
MDLYEKISSKAEKVSVIGLGYVGLPLAVAFDAKSEVIGFDTSAEKIALYKKGIDPTNEVGDNAISSSEIFFTSNPEDLKSAKFHIVAVPTPVNKDETPDFRAIKSATKILGKQLQKGSYVVYESTVFPGVTEEICIPILEQESGLVSGKDFKVGYSPERINPADKIHKLSSIVKIVSGMDKESLGLITKVYELIISAGVYQASSIKVAEAAKVIENSQRDVNIAFVNEVSKALSKAGISANEVIDAMDTKWNALKFRPGLVGGHCIGVDPYYYIYQSKSLGYVPQMVSIGRGINNSMGAYIADKVVKELALTGKAIKGAKVTILGLTFKEDCPDVRNTKVIDIILRLKEYGIEAQIVDPWVPSDITIENELLKLTKLEDVENQDILIVAVAHIQFKQLTENDLARMINSNKCIFDIKNTFDRDYLTTQGYHMWNL